MRLLIIIFSLSLITLSCRDNRQQGIITIGEYTFEFPSDFTLIKDKGIDSYVGRIAGNKWGVGFDYGYYSSGIVETTQEFLDKGHWKFDAYSWFVKPKGIYRPEDVRRIELISTKPVLTLVDSNKFKGPDLIAVCKFNSTTFEFGITLPKEIKQHRFIIDTIYGRYRKIVLANDAKHGYTGIYLRDLHSYNESINGFLALSMATSDLTRQQQDSLLRVFLNVKITPK